MIKHIFVIDDSDTKRERVANAMRTLFPGVPIQDADCIIKGRDLIGDCGENMREHPEEYLIVTDMIMPLYKHEIPQRNGSTRLLHAIKRNYGITSPAIVVSSEYQDPNPIRRAYPRLLGCVMDDGFAYAMPQYREILAEYLPA